MGGTQVVVNGIAAPLLFVSPERIELQLPAVPASEWSMVVRHSGLESEPVVIAGVAAEPRILGTRLREGGFLEIYAIGLGLTSPPLAAGFGADPTLPLPAVALPVQVLLEAGGQTVALDPTYAGPQPYQPGRYQVNVQLPAGVTAGRLWLRVADVLSPAAML
jgi:uncharacterized protein (TIGR03437 family)